MRMPKFISSVPMKPYVRENNSKFYMPSETRRLDWDEGLTLGYGNYPALPGGPHFSLSLSTLGPTLDREGSVVRL